MGIRRIDKNLCIKCGICVNVCPSDVLRVDKDNNVLIMYLRDCQSCHRCEIECPMRAIYVSPIRERMIVFPW